MEQIWSKLDVLQHAKFAGCASCSTPAGLMAILEKHCNWLYHQRYHARPSWASALPRTAPHQAAFYSCKRVAMSGSTATSSRDRNPSVSQLLKLC